MKVALLILLMIVFSGCAAKKIAVDHADTMLELQVEKRLPLYSKQKDQLSRDIDTFLNNKKLAAQDMLPVIDSINLNKPQNIDAQYAKLMSFFRNVSLDFSLIMAKYMIQLDQKQQKEFFETLAEENQTTLKRDPEDRREALEDKIEKILGSVNDKQRKILDSYEGYYLSQTKNRVEKRTLLYSEFKKILSQKTSPPEKQKLLHDTYEKYYDLQVSTNKSLEIIQKFIPTITPEQKETFRTQTAEIKEILNLFVQASY